MSWNPKVAEIVNLKWLLPHKVRINVPNVSRRTCMSTFRKTFREGKNAAAVITYNGVAHTRVEFMFATPELLQQFNETVRPIIEQ